MADSPTARSDAPSSYAQLFDGDAQMAAQHVASAMAARTIHPQGH
jgi:hypothetical protein